MNARLRVGVDVDGVLYQWEPTARLLLNREFGLELTESPYWNYLNDNTTKAQMDWLWDSHFTYPAGLDAPPVTFRGVFAYGPAYPEAAKALREIRSLGHKIALITSMPNEAISERVNWLRTAGMVFDEFHTTHAKDKSKVACDVYIEDSAENITRIAEERPHAGVYLVDRAWNRNQPLHPAVKVVAGIHELPRELPKAS